MAAAGFTKARKLTIYRSIVETYLHHSTPYIPAIAEMHRNLCLLAATIVVQLLAVTTAGLHV
jgi:hypothetical protein